ncbi:MAG TPA: serine hydrolase domain-containing protein [Chloroflexota bacterium]
MGIALGPSEVLASGVRDGDVPGIVALAANRDGIIYEGAFGERQLGGGTEMTLDSVFWIASMTKALTTVAALQLVEQARLSLDSPISTVLPRLKDVQVLEGFDQQGMPRLRPPARPITLRHLLTHTAGFGYDIWNADIGRYMAHAGLPSVSECKNAALTTPLVFDPGDRWEYGINIDWAGKAVEAVSGLSLDAYLRHNLFEPLGMRDTGFVLGTHQRARLVSMHVRDSAGALTPIAFEVPQEPEFFMGGGGLYSTGPDYLRFLRMLLNQGTLDGEQVLKSDTVDKMFANQIGDIDAGVMYTTNTKSSLDHNPYPGMPIRWGLGFMITMEPTPHGRSGGSVAWAGLANTYYWIDAAQGIAGVIMTQILPFVDPKVMQLYGRFERAIYT